MKALTSTGQRGFSVVELMVSVVIGLLAVMFATRLVTNAESSKQSSLGGSDSMQNGMLAMFSISGDIAQAGWGLNDPLLVGCDTTLTDSGGFTLASATRGAVAINPLAAAVIVSNGANPDTISLYAGSSISGTGSMRVTQDTNANAVSVDRIPYGFARNDVILLAPETAGASKCVVAEISSDPTALAAPPAPQTISTTFNAGATRFNAAAYGTTFLASQARLFNLGQASSLVFHTWSVANGFLRLNATDLNGAGAAAATVVDNVVSIKAEYGLDMRVGLAFDAQAGMVVTRWSATMLDADSNGVAGSAGDYQRIAALRVAVVARSRAPERAGSSGVCSATPSALSVFTSDTAGGVAAVPIQLNLVVAGDTVDWKCYRYRVFESIVPLRNSGWRPTA